MYRNSEKVRDMNGLTTGANRESDYLPVSTTCGHMLYGARNQVDSGVVATTISNKIHDDTERRAQVPWYYLQVVPSSTA